ncbi:MAG: hypothetical protein AB1374_09020 [Bacillota bacterium]
MADRAREGIELTRKVQQITGITVSTPVGTVKEEAVIINKLDGTARNIRVRNPLE